MKRKRPPSESTHKQTPEEKAIKRPIKRLRKPRTCLPRPVPIAYSPDGLPVFPNDDTDQYEDLLASLAVYHDKPECEANSLGQLTNLPDQSQSKLTLPTNKIPHKALVELARVIKPNGFLIIQIPPPKVTGPFRPQGQNA